MVHLSKILNLESSVSLSVKLLSITFALAPQVPSDLFTLVALHLVPSSANPFPLASTSDPFIVVALHLAPLSQPLHLAPSP